MYIMSNKKDAQMEGPQPGAEALLRLQDIRVQWLPMPAVIDGLELQLRPGEFTAILGPSGCGKSTLLRVMAGLQRVTHGHLERSTDAQAFVFQEPTLMPWATVEENVWLPLRLQGLSRAQVKSRIQGVLQRVGLADRAQAYPHELSGGMKMRTSIARALVTQPELLLMDEPFAALDDITRNRLNEDLSRWWQQQSFACAFVTHNVSEAVWLSQRVVVMSAHPGRVRDVIEVEAPFPRPVDFRDSAAFHELCARARRSLEQVSEVAE